jgi:hypothetical protein
MPMMSRMSRSDLEPLGYHVPAERIDAGWPLLRFAVIVWTLLVLGRHASYWGPRLVPMLGPATFFSGSGGLLSYTVVLEVARLLRILGTAYFVLILLTLQPDFLSFSRQPNLPSMEMFAWRVLSRVQLLMVPLLCMAYRTRAAV